MGTKQQPGYFDCYAAALPDEPMFVLLARDPLAGFLVSIWSSVRYGDFEAASVKFDAMLDRAGRRYIMDPDVERASEALDCAVAMFAWRTANDGRWRISEAQAGARPACTPNSPPAPHAGDEPAPAALNQPAPETPHA